MWKTVYNHLKLKGFDVYSPGQHEGLCTSSFIVLRDAGGNRFAGSTKLGWTVIDIIIMHPVNNYSTLGDYAKSALNAAKELSDLKFTGLQTPTLIDEEKKAYTTSFQFQIIKRL